jgi:hypothetical protein
MNLTNKYIMRETNVSNVNAITLNVLNRIRMEESFFNRTGHLLIYSSYDIDSGTILHSFDVPVFHGDDTDF